MLAAMDKAAPQFETARTAAAEVREAAAEAGADRVTAIETNPAIAAVSREVVAASGHDEKVEVVTAHSRSIGMAGVPPERRPNLLVSEIVDASLVGEGLRVLVRRDDRLGRAAQRVEPRVVFRVPAVVREL